MPPALLPHHGDTPVSAAAVRIKTAGATLASGLAWWRDGLEAALPAWLVRPFAGDRQCVCIAETAGVLQARLFAAPTAKEPLAEARFGDPAIEPQPAARTVAVAARSVPVILEAPSSKILTQTVRMPAAALENLDDAVRFGLSTWTPFAAEEVVFHASVVERADEHARVRIQMIPLAVLRPVMERAADAGLNVSAVALGPNLVRFGDAGHAVERRRRRAARLDLALGASAFALGLGLLITMHLGWTQEREELRAEIRAEMARLAAQTKLESELNQLQMRQRSVLSKRAAETRVSALIADLAERLPETAEVLEFEWSGKRGRLRASTSDDVDLGVAFAESSLITVKRERDGRHAVQSFELTTKATQ